MTTDELALRATMLANPADDAPRLVLADWYDEHDQPERAKFIRVGCELAHITEESDPRRNELAAIEEALVAKHHAQWLKPYGVFMEQVKFRRGFVYQYAEAEGWKPKNLKALFDHEPITELELHTTAIAEQVLFQHARLATIESLDLSSMTMSSDELSLLLGSHDWPTLTTINVGWCEEPEAGFAKFFRTTMKNVCEIDLCGIDGLSPTRLSKLLAGLARFKKISLGYTDLGDEGLMELTAKRYPQLEYLDVGAESISATGLIDFLAEAKMPKMRTFRIFANNIGNDGAEALATRSPWPKLEELDVGNCGFTTKAARAFAASTVLKQLRRLHVGNELNNTPNRIGDLGLRALVNSEHFPNLRELDVLYNGLTVKAMNYLCDSPLLAQLWKLNLNNNAIGDEGAIRLAKCPSIANLRMVGLLGCTLTQKGAEALLESPYWSPHVRINVDDNKIPKPLLKKFQKRFPTVPTNRFARSFAA